MLWLSLSLCSLFSRSLQIDIRMRHSFETKWNNNPKTYWGLSFAIRKIRSSLSLSHTNTLYGITRMVNYAKLAKVSQCSAVMAAPRDTYGIFNFSKNVQNLRGLVTRTQLYAPHHKCTSRLYICTYNMYYTWKDDERLNNNHEKKKQQHRRLEYEEAEKKHTHTHTTLDTNGKKWTPLHN